MKNKKPIIILFVFAILALIVYLFRDKIINLFKPKTTWSTDKSDTTPVYTNPSPTAITEGLSIPDDEDLNRNMVLKRGSTGSEVEALQTMINAALKFKKYAPIVVDGAFGPKTEAALNLLTNTKQTTLAKFYTAMVKKLAGQK